MKWRKKKEGATTRAKKSASAKIRWSRKTERQRASEREKARFRVCLKPKLIEGSLPAQAERLGKLYAKRGGALLDFQPHPAAQAWGRENAWLITATDPQVAGVEHRFLRCLERAGLHNVGFYADPMRRGGVSVHCIAVVEQPS